MPEGKTKGPTLAARVSALEARMDALESKDARPASEAAPTDEELLAAQEIRALLDPSSAQPSTAASEGAPIPEAEPEAEPDWPGELEPTLWIEALAVPETMQGKPIVFAAEPVDQAAVARLVAEIGRPIPVVGRPIEDVVPRLRELFGAA